MIERSRCEECNGEITLMGNEWVCSKCGIVYNNIFDSNYSPYRVMISSGDTFPFNVGKDTHSEFLERFRNFKAELTHTFIESQYIMYRNRGKRTVDKIIDEISKEFSESDRRIVKRILKQAYNYIDFFFGKKIDGKWHIFYDKRGRGRRVKEIALFLIHFSLGTYWEKLLTGANNLEDEISSQKWKEELKLITSISDVLWEKYPYISRIVKRESKNLARFFGEEIDPCFEKIEKIEDDLYKLFHPPKSKIGGFDNRYKQVLLRHSLTKSILIDAQDLFWRVALKLGKKRKKGLLPACIYASAVNYSIKKYVSFAYITKQPEQYIVLPSSLDKFAKFFSIDIRTLKKRIRELTEFDDKLEKKIKFIQSLV